MSDTLEQIGEREMITRLVNTLGAQGAPCGVNGDDCAVVHGDNDLDWLLTSDPVIRGTHFTERDDPADVGHKAVGRVLSDIAAMGGDPRWILVNITAPGASEGSWLESAYAGAARLAARFDTAIVGGDVARGNDLALHVFGIGSAPRGKALMRSGGHAGDTCFVTGKIGGSRVGHHLTFTPRIQEGAWLRDWATAMIDLSDGLATDLRHLTVASETSAKIDREALPVSDAAKGGDRTPLEHALYDGEDFELLFTIPPGREARFIEAWRQAFTTPCTLIGALCPGDGKVVLRGPDNTETPLEPDGYQHFVSP